MYLLDTNIISETRRARPHGGVMAWLAATDPDALYLSAATLGELQAGVELAREQDSGKADEIERWIDLLSARIKVLPTTGEIFRLWAKLMHHRSDDLMIDTMIAATAMIHRLVVVTRNARDFRPFEIETLNPYDTPRAL